MPHATPTLPFPTIKPATAPIAPREEVPRNCVRRGPTVGGQSIELKGYDAGGNVWIRVEINLRAGEERIEAWARLMARESANMPDLLAPTRAAAFAPRGLELVE